MAKDQVQYSLRFNKELYDEVQTISKLSESTMSKFILTAIKKHTTQKRKELQRTLSENLQLLQQYAERDPNFTEAIDRVANAEVAAEPKLAEGQLFDVRDEVRKAPIVDTQSLEEFLENA